MRVVLRLLRFLCRQEFGFFSTADIQLQLFYRLLQFAELLLVCVSLHQLILPAGLDLFVLAGCPCHLAVLLLQSTFQLLQLCVPSLELPLQLLKVLSQHLALRLIPGSQVLPLVAALLQILSQGVLVGLQLLHRRLQEADFLVAYGKFVLEVGYLVLELELLRSRLGLLHI